MLDIVTIYKTDCIGNAELEIGGRCRRSPAVEEKAMVQPPPFPDDGISDGAPERDERTPRLKTALGILIAVIVIGLIVYAHLAGVVGPGAH
jgi:hypothetical protein